MIYLDIIWSILPLVVVFVLAFLFHPLTSPFYRIMDWLEERDERNYVRLREKYKECNLFYCDFVYDDKRKGEYFVRLEKDVL